MGDTTEIEKKSLEAHVELCAERYRFLEDKLETVEEKITGLSAVIREVHDMIHAMAEKRNNQVLAWGTGLVASLFAIIGYLLITHVFK
jgi:chromosome segregation ATPase